MYWSHSLTSACCIKRGGEGGRERRGREEEREGGREGERGKDDREWKMEGRRLRGNAMTLEEDKK